MLKKHVGILFFFLIIWGNIFAVKSAYYWPDLKIAGKALKDPVGILKKSELYVPYILEGACVFCINTAFYVYFEGESYFIKKEDCDHVLQTLDDNLICFVLGRKENGLKTIEGGNNSDRIDKLLRRTELRDEDLKFSSLAQRTSRGFLELGLTVDGWFTLKLRLFV
ncbi:MAG: hypothetical protein US69_C0017G0006 [candidate division TM6 bacterium GW2011_GWF2_38_10]|nr:MAG: hypothetical protein US69_C0017G0006 [candidate division TM6 bacterium GW2011_GWF2_38_10]